ncbi:TetR/AcrR family transcriptional regulator [Diaphorobacter aerolatus]|uniref:TetR/AcrR family transcriptional regulator n=1 Tax=Diaphorobacter aerolatus TaxID=1288495 RepID=A0A7H0GGC9_9BURK|nr:TetR/AcrR family transcriptional regulator [Diaphorobacter aerolatus]QNP47345.1 TetR/AcrR family transcriptional regulator [Diaphorobacter aerolatus]
MPAAKKSVRQVGRRPATPDANLREQLLDVTVRLFAEHGIAGTTVARIAAAASVTSAMVHYHFTHRESLLDAVADERLAPLARYVWHDSDSDANDPIALIERLIDRMFVVIVQSPWLPSLWLREVANTSGLLHQRMKARIPFDRIRELGDALLQAQRAGRINALVDPGMLFISILGLVMLPFATATVWQGQVGIATLDAVALKRHVHALLLGACNPGHTPD